MLVGEMNEWFTTTVLSKCDMNEMYVIVHENNNNNNNNNNNWWAGWSCVEMNDEWCTSYVVKMTH